MATTKTLQNDVSKDGQTVHFQRIDVLANGRKLRTRIASDAYRFQCYARAELWDGNKWNEVAHIDPQAMATREGLAYMPTPVTAAAFAADYTKLQAIAKAVAA